MAPHLDTLEVEPEGPAMASVIWMHGLGADARDFYSLPPQLGLPDSLKVRYVFPNAPRIPVTINMGMIMRAWYDVAAIDRSAPDEPRIRRSAGWIDELSARENERGVPDERIVLAGFSQGGAMALFAGTRYPRAYAGIMCLSGYLLLDESLEAEAGPAARDVPIFQAHGTEDPVVPHPLARASFDRLVRAGFRAEWHEYPMGHTVTMEEVREIGAWLRRVLAPGW